MQTQAIMNSSRGSWNLRRFSWGRLAWVTPGSFPLRMQTTAHRRTEGRVACWEQGEGVFRDRVQGELSRLTSVATVRALATQVTPCFFRSVSEGYHEGIHKALEVEQAGVRPGSSLQDVSVGKQPTGSLNSVISARKKNLLGILGKMEDGP